MPNEPERVYWDACVFIHRIQGTAGKIDLLEQLTDLAQKGKLKLITSALTITEVLRGPDPDAPDEEQAELIIAYFENEYIEVRPVDVMIAEYAARLRRKFKGLKAVDAIHVATAHFAKVAVLQTYDHDDLLKRDGRMCDPPLAIREPAHPEAYPLFDDPPRDDDAG